MGIDVSFDHTDMSVKGQVQAWLLLLMVAIVVGIGLFIGIQIANKVA